MPDFPRHPPGTVVHFRLGREYYYITRVPGTVIRIHTELGLRLGVPIGSLDSHDMMYEGVRYWRALENPCPVMIRRNVSEEYRA